MALLKTILRNVTLFYVVRCSGSSRAPIIATDIVNGDDETSAQYVSLSQCTAVSARVCKILYTLG